ncbi:hypothetical protein AB0D35_08000 [Streptomyces sp. NPDC048301]|uniref:hypothetical protein n=1 Tax=unclassified Streptomyces TaxID=2593676 RepID=UPI00342A0CFF
MRVPKPLLIGWSLVAVVGWAATLWLGEPSATAGPGPAPGGGVQVDNPEPGPQPEGGCESPSPAPSRSEGTDPLLTAKVPEGIDENGLMAQRYCVTITARDGATAR